MAYKELELGKVMGGGWEIWTRDVVPLVVGGLIAALLGVVTLGILLPVLSAGLYKMVAIRVREDRKPEIGDVFSCFDQFWRITWAFLVVGILVGIGLILCIIPGIWMAVNWVYVMPFIVDKRVSTGEAMSLSKQKVGEWGFASHLVILLILSIVVALVSAVPMAGILATPYFVACIMVMYFTVTMSDEKPRELKELPSVRPYVGPAAGGFTPPANDPFVPPVVAATEKCPSCGFELPKTAVFCPKCGTRKGS
jgi:hypothetical protein